MVECDGESAVPGNASDEVVAVHQCRPAPDAPVRLWVIWLTRYAESCEVIAQEVALPDVAGDALWMGDYARRMAKELQENYQPDDVWPGAATW